MCETGLEGGSRDISMVGLSMQICCICRWAVPAVGTGLWGPELGLGQRASEAAGSLLAEGVDGDWEGYPCSEELGRALTGDWCMRGLPMSCRSEKGLEDAVLQSEDWVAEGMPGLPGEVSMASGWAGSREACGASRFGEVMGCRLLAGIMDAAAAAVGSPMGDGLLH